MMTALIVDDEPLARSRLRRLLEAQEVQIVDEADHAATALQQAEDLHPDLLFLDIQMPGLTGMQIRSSIIAPLMLRNVLPSLSSTIISLFKDTSLAAAIAVPELTFAARKINVESFRVIET